MEKEGEKIGGRIQDSSFNPFSPTCQTELDGNWVEAP